jgi:iron complex transport system substrate-binding protein
MMSLIRSALLATLVVTHSCGAPDLDSRDTLEQAADPLPRPPQASSAAELTRFPFAIVDAAGVEHRLSSPPSRIVSLVPSATETLVALGARDLLAGRTDHDADETLATLPSVGGGLHPDLEALVALSPDLVIRFAGRADPTTPAQLDRLGIRHFAVRPDRLNDVLEVVKTLGKLVGRGERARALAAQIENELAEVKNLVKGQEPVRVAYLVGGRPPLVAGPSSFIHDLMELAGGDNVFADLTSRYAPASLEELMARRIDLILVASGTSSGLPGRMPVRQVPQSIEIPGIHVGGSARRLAGIFHPEVFR